jgi:hypothetical protein
MLAMADPTDQLRSICGDLVLQVAQLKAELEEGNREIAKLRSEVTRLSIGCTTPSPSPAPQSGDPKDPDWPLRLP